MLHHPLPTAPQPPVTLDFSPLVGYPCQLQLTHWEYGIQWSVEANEEPGDCHPHESPGLSLQLLLGIEEARDWVSGIPVNIRDTMARYHDLAGGETLTALWYLSRYEPAQELFLSHPMLFLMLVRHAIDNEIAPAELVPLFTRKRTELLRCMDYEPSPALLRLIAKIDPSRFSLAGFAELRRVVQLPEWKSLNHLQQIDGALIHYLSAGWPLLGARFLSRIDSNWNWPGYLHNCKEIHRMCGQLGYEDADSRIMRCADFEALRALHDRLSAQFQRMDFDENAEYPPPPWPGNDTIVPISTPRELLNEGRIMSHCVYSFHHLVMHGQYVVYRVLEPQRATLGMQIMPDGRVMIDQLKLEYNRAPDLATREAVQKWFDAMCGK